MMETVNSSNQSNLASLRTEGNRENGSSLKADAPRRKAGDSDSSDKKEDASFESKLMGAAAMTSPSAAAMPKSGLSAQGGKSSLMGTLAEALPMTQKPAASLNTADAVAGLKPWSRDWVFEGKQDAFMNEGEPKTLLSLLAGKKGAQEAAASMTGKAVAGNPAAAGKAGELPADLSAEQTMQLMELLRGMGGEAQTGEPAGAKVNREMIAAALAQAQVQGSNVAAPASEQAQLMATGGTSLSQLHGQMMAAMNGEVVPNGAQHGQGPGKGLAVVGGPGAQSELSGSEYLNMLNSVRGTPGFAGMGQQGGEAGTESGGEGMKDASRFRLIEGGGAKDRHSSIFGEGEQLFMGGSPAALHSLSANHGSQPGFGAMPAVEMTGHVTKGAMAQDRLSSESLAGLSTQITNVSPQSGGEIRIRLKPGNLGELQVRVVTDGNNVGLKIQASDEKAKQILEESISHLRESLATHRLSLASVDVAVAGAAGGSLGNLAGDGSQGNSQPQYQSQQQGSQFDLTGQNNSRQGGREGRWVSDGEMGGRMANAAGRSSNVNATASSAGYAIPMGAASRASYLAPGRVDVRA